MWAVTRLLPRGGQDWSRAMGAELEGLPDGRRLQWACGCLMAALIRRMEFMKTGNLTISRWVLVPEMVLCFLPLTLAFVGSIYEVKDIAQLDATHLHKYFLADASGWILLLSTPLVVLTTAIGGPVSLAVTAWYVGQRRGLRAGWLGQAMVAAPLLMGLGLIILRISNGGLAAFGPNRVDAFDFYGGLMLLSVLPALGAVHLRRLFANAAGRAAHPGPESR
jgi:hypothetical protein